jgi:NAD(P)-dependent dehydrogenase (short-subunit alcohol dehydrogenase family)
MAVAIVTGASKGLGAALARALAGRGWQVVVDARGADALRRTVDEIRTATGAEVVAVPGDVADPAHRADLVAAAAKLGRLDLLVNNASVLGPSPQPELGAYPLDVLEDVYRVNVLAPLGLVQAALPLLAVSGGRVLNVTSDAAVEPYEGWGGYGSSKAALEQLSAILAAEHPGLRVWWVDPGDLRTEMHQAAFPGEDISDRPLPEAVVPGFLRLLDEDRPSGRYRAAELVPAPATAAVP